MEVVMSRCGRILLAILILLVVVPSVAFAQATNSPPAQGDQSQPASQPAQSEQLLKTEQLEALVAPIALYSDELLAKRAGGINLSAGGRAGRSLDDRDATTASRRWPAPLRSFP
jgi:hypothetical protein